MAITHIEPRMILEAQVGHRGSYISDALCYKDAPEATRIEITEEMANALLGVVGWTTYRCSCDGKPWMGNKEYVCVAAMHETRLFVYQHDSTWYLYEVGRD